MTQYTMLLLCTLQFIYIYIFNIIKYPVIHTPADRPRLLCDWTTRAMYVKYTQ
uniref:Uncharacterized protein n=1 Tax=Anguilla anguilla TaxID=7936 RepID=A0A0E9PS95_ANGAN